MRLEIWVRPGASRAGVHGVHDGALVVRVVEPADRGRATRAALRAVADAFGVPSRAVTLVRGPTSRRKTVEIDTTEEQAERLRADLDRLLREEGGS